MVGESVHVLLLSGIFGFVLAAIAEYVLVVWGRRKWMPGSRAIQAIHRSWVGQNQLVPFAVL